MNLGMAKSVCGLGPASTACAKSGCIAIDIEKKEVEVKTCFHLVDVLSSLWYYCQ